MTINTNAAIAEKAAQETVISAGVIANGAFSTQAQAIALTLSTLAAPIAGVRWADASLDITVPTLATTGKRIYLYRRDMNHHGDSKHAPVPGVNYEDIYIGSFKLNAVGTQQFISHPAVPISDDAEYYIKNDTGLSTSGTTVVKLTPWTWNGKPA